MIYLRLVNTKTSLKSWHGAWIKQILFSTYSMVRACGWSQLWHKKRYDMDGVWGTLP